MNSQARSGESGVALVWVLIFAVIAGGISFGVQRASTSYARSMANAVQAQANKQLVRNLRATLTLMENRDYLRAIALRSENFALRACVSPGGTGAGAPDCIDAVHPFVLYDAAAATATTPGFIPVASAWNGVTTAGVGYRSDGVLCSAAQLAAATHPYYNACPYRASVEFRAFCNAQPTLVSGDFDAGVASPSGALCYDARSLFVRLRLSSPGWDALQAARAPGTPYVNSPLMPFPLLNPSLPKNDPRHDPQWTQIYFPALAL